MPERGTGAQVMRAGPTIDLGCVTLLPIMRVELQSIRCGAQQWFSAAIEPHALIVRDADCWRAITAGAGAGEGSIEELRAQVPGLATILAMI